ncbi:MAG TPA: SpoIIE family protein phosphatase [Solirubrobacteraceae bacterium]|nr:SpoIIE family protein phosphatase [Solirubrobacteraceae bacterium]
MDSPLAMDADRPTPHDAFARELLGRAPIAVGAFDAELRWAWVNDALAEMNRVTAGELLGRRPSELHGELGASTEVILRRVLGSCEPERHAQAGELGTEPGVVRHWDVTYFPIRGGVGIAAIDVTDRYAAEAALSEAHRRDALMARAGQLLSTALSVNETADLIAQLVVPEIADWCFVELAREDGHIERVSFRHRDPSKLPWLAELDRRYPLDPDSPVGSPKVIRTAEPELIPELPDELLVAAAQDEEHLRILREIGFVSVCIVPLMARGRVLGDIALATDAKTGRRFGPELLPLARELADRCALALDNAMVYAQRDLVAMSLQEELLPPDLPRIPGLDVGARYSAAGEGNEVGGDFYDLFPTERGWRVVIGDVVGKGPSAAAVTGLARHTLRAAAPYERSPSALLAVLNRALLAEKRGDRLASVACVELERDGDGVALTVSAAGHPLPLLVDADGNVREVGRFGHLLGVDAGHVAVDVHDRLGPGDTLVLYTDGVVEARGPAGVFGEERLRAMLADSAGEAPTRIVQRIEGAVLAASGGRPRDDLAVVALRVRPRRRR